MVASASQVLMMICVHCIRLLLRFGISIHLVYILCLCYLFVCFNDYDNFVAISSRTQNTEKKDSVFLCGFALLACLLALNLQY